MLRLRPLRLSGSATRAAVRGPLGPGLPRWVLGALALGCGAGLATAHAVDPSSFSEGALDGAWHRAQAPGERRAGPRGGRSSRATAATPLSPFGIATSAEASNDFARFMPRLEKAGVRTLRLVEKWPAVERSKGQFDFSRDDSRVAMAARHGITITGLLHQTARWALPEGVTNVKTFPMMQLPAWRGYVAKATARLGDRVKYWEIWNEPNTRSFNVGGHSARDYARLVREACTAARATPGDIQLAITTANYDVRFLSLVVSDLARTGSTSCFDFIAVHPYELANGMALADGEVYYLQIVKNLRSMLRRLAPDRASVPIWFSELGVKVKGPGPGSPRSQQRAADLLVKAYVLGIAQGVAHLQWFEAQDAGGSQGLGLLDDDLTPRTAFHAYRALTTALGSNPAYLGWVALGPSGRGYGIVFKAGSGYVLAAWAPAGHAVTLPAGVGWRSVDIHTGDVSPVPPRGRLAVADKPTLVLLPAGAGSNSYPERARRNHDKPFPWGTRAKSPGRADLDLGRAAPGRGIQLMAAPDVRGHRFQDGTGGVVVGRGHRRRLRFALDPAFANYATRKVDVTVWARALRPAAKGGGMNLWYQPAPGGADGRPPYPYANARKWFAVQPDNRWHKYTWHLTDAMFVNTFGYGFALASDNSAATVVSRIEVTKSGPARSR